MHEKYSYQAKNARGVRGGIESDSICAAVRLMLEPALHVWRGHLLFRMFASPIQSGAGHTYHWIKDLAPLRQCIRDKFEEMRGVDFGLTKCVLLCDILNV